MDATQIHVQMGVIALMLMQDMSASAQSGSVVGLARKSHHCVAVIPVPMGEPVMRRSEDISARVCLNTQELHVMD